MLTLTLVITVCQTMRIFNQTCNKVWCVLALTPSPLFDIFLLYQYHSLWMACLLTDPRDSHIQSRVVPVDRVWLEKHWMYSANLKKEYIVYFEISPNINCFFVMGRETNFYHNFVEFEKHLELKYMIETNTMRSRCGQGVGLLSN